MDITNRWSITEGELFFKCPDGYCEFEMFKNNF